MARRTDEHDKEIIDLRGELSKMRAAVGALEERVTVLEIELAAARGGNSPDPPLLRGGSIRPSTPAAKRSSRGAGPPPLPNLPANMPALPKTASRAPGKRGDVDISELAELVESVPPPPGRGTRR